jgi:STE24 endopeptidase
MCGMVAHRPSRGRVALDTALAVAGAQAAAALLAPRERVPRLEVPVAAHFTDEEVARARRFRRPQRALGLGAAAVEAAVLGALTARPPRGRPAAVGAALSLALAAAPLPLRAVARERARRVGLVTQSWGGWAGDLAKASAIGAGIAAGGSAVAVALRARAPRGWWLPGAGATVAAGAAAVFAGPVVLDPLFNRFEPLPEGETRRDVLDLAWRAGVEVKEVYVVDATRRTTAANAYVTGLGPTKRVVLYDTLVDGFTRDETRLVVAHELAHVAHRDVRRGLAFLALAAPPAARAVARLTDRLARAGGAGALPALALATGIVSVPLAWVANGMSRRVEAAADAFALRLTGEPEPFISFERRIALRNVGDPEPRGILAALSATHPTTMQRIGIAQAYAEARQ